MLFSMLVSILGITSVIAQIEHLFRHRLIREKTLVKLKVFSPPLVGLSVFYLIHTPVLLLSLIGLVASLPFLFMVLNRKRREKLFTSRILGFLDQLILGLRGGSSLRVSLKKTGSDAFLQESWDLQEAIRAIVDKNVVPNGLSSNAKWIFFEIQKIEEAPVRQLERLLSLRDHQRRQLRFQQKTRLASRQVESQIVLASLMFIALTLMTVYLFPHFLFHPLFYLSILLFASGVCAFCFIKRSFHCPL